MYTKKVMQHFTHPKHAGEIKNPDGVGIAGSLKCGDVMKLFIKVKNNKIIDAKFKTFGCVAAISNSDVLCDLVIGKTIEQAKKITDRDIIKILGKMPEIKYHCSILGAQTLKKAIEDYEKKKK